MTQVFKNSAFAVYLTTRCNLNCPHCLRRLFDKNKNLILDLPLEAFEEILRSAKRFGFNVISFTGGEPILHPQFGHFLELCAQYNYKFTLVSNGSFFNEYWDSLKNHLQNLSFISLSLDGSKPGIHDRQRNQPGSFESVIKAIKFYQKKGIRCLGTTTCLTKYNKDDIAPIINLCRKMGIRNIKFLQSLLTSKRDSYHLGEKESQNLFKQIRKAAKDFASDVSIRIGSHQHLIKAEQINFCNVLDNPHFSVDSAAGLIFCCDLYQLPESRPNILKDGFIKSVFMNLAIIQELKEQRSRDLARNKFALPFEFYDCRFCNNHIDNAILKVRRKKIYELRR